jgi:hypothetical protein
MNWGLRAAVVALPVVLAVSVSSCAPPKVEGGDDTTTSTSTTITEPASSVDQSYTPSNADVDCGNRTPSVGQTFTAGRTGVMDTVSIMVDGSGLAVVEIHADSPTGANLSVAGHVVSGATQFVNIPLSTTVPVQAGQVYAIVIDEAPTICEATAGYSLGDEWLKQPTWSASSSGDLPFKTWVL